MANVTVPSTNKKSELGQLGGIVGGVAGAYYGGSPQAAAGGYAAGQQVGQAVDPDKQASTPTAESNGQAAMQRRSEALAQYQQPGQYEQQLAQAEAAAQQLPTDQQAAYLPAIQAARARAASTGGSRA